MVTLLLRGAALLIGLQAIAFFYARALYDSYATKPPSAEFWSRIEQERSNLWSLNEEDSKVKGLEGFRHAFEDVATEGGKVRMHYITNVPTPITSGLGAEQPKDLIILLHGWPDNCMVWRHVLTQLKDKSYNLVAPDIPGHGGSQSLHDYGPAAVLPVLFHFISSMRRQHISSTPESSTTKPKLILVGHDWGAAISARLASECPELIDQVILTNGPIVHLAISNVKQNLNHAYTQARAGSYSQGWQMARPYLTQIFLRSSYIWAFNLPMLFIRPLGTFGDMWFLRVIARSANGRPENVEGESVVNSLAEMLGPNLSAAGSKTRFGYHNNVAQRAVNLNARFFESIKLYREGLASGIWEQSKEVKDARMLLPTSSSPFVEGKSNTLAATRPQGALRVPLTLLWCIEDVALNHRICVDGVEDYLHDDSMAIKFKGKEGRKIGHWTPITASKELAQTVTWVAQGKQGDLSKELANGISVVDLIER